MQSLLPLPLQGRDSYDIEALPSYLSRLGTAHGVTPGGLLTYLLNGSDDGIALSRALAAQPFAASVRPNATTENVIKALASARCESECQLRRSTFVHLSLALARSPRTYSKRLRWCPGCLYEQTLGQGNAYLKLTWFLEDIHACEIHRVVLRGTCPYCDHAPRPWSGWPDFTRCQQCKGRLDMITSRDQLDSDPISFAPDLIGLVQDLSTRTTPYPVASVNRYVDSVFSEAWASQREEALWKKLPRDECIRYASMDEPISLSVARRIAFRLEVPLLELLDCERPTIRSFGFASEAQLPHPFEQRSKPTRIDKTELLRKLKAIVEAEEEPRSLRDVARRLSVSVGALLYHSPDLAALIVRPCVATKTAQGIRTKALVSGAVSNAIHSRTSAGEPLARKTLLRDLYRETGLPKNLLRVEISAQFGSNQNRTNYACM